MGSRTVLLAAAVVLVGIGSGVVVSGETTATAAHVPSADCGDGSDGGAVFVADSGFEVVDDSNGAMPDDGPFADGATIRIGNVTLSADGNASVGLENATKPVCLAAVNATETTVRIELGDDTVIVGGAADRLSVGDIAFDPDAGGTDIVYDAASAVEVTLPDTGLSAGTTVEAVGVDSGTVLVAGSVDDSGALSLTLPADSTGVDLVTHEATTTTAPPTETAPETETETEAATATKTETTTETETETETTTETETETETTTETETETETTTETGTTTGPETPTETESGPTPGFGVVAALAALAAALLARQR